MFRYLGIYSAGSTQPRSAIETRRASERYNTGTVAPFNWNQRGDTTGCTDGSSSATCEPLGERSQSQTKFQPGCFAVLQKKSVQHCAGLRPSIKTQDGVGNLVPDCTQSVQRLVKAPTWCWKFLVCFMPFAFKDPKGFRSYEQDLKCAGSAPVPEILG